MKECNGCARREERTANGFRRIKLNADGICRACVEAAADAAADDAEKVAR